ncbi:MAG: tyrosine-protein phosphatase [Planctomycetes bacterium]|nr:tyrosine-protein phosphatase [Planctomycetota bacterium]
MKTKLPILLIALLLAACASEAPMQQPPGDSAKSIEPAKLGDTPTVSRYRNLWFAAQPGEGDWQAVKDAGIKQVIDLRDRDEDRGYDESEMARNAGLSYEVFELRKQEFSPEVVEAAVSALDKAARTDEPTLVHCASSNRVGMVVAIWKYRDGEHLEDAIKAGEAAGMQSDNVVRKYLQDHPQAP